MSSRSSTPQSPPASSSHSKRLSSTLSTGPRPLHLVDGNIPLATPYTSVVTELPSPPPSSKNTSPFNKPKSRRQSSISYHTSTTESSRSPLASPRPTLTRSLSIAYSPGTSPGDPRGENTIPKRQQLTLAEKHSELLHFIAQKESKCLELRLQLAANEAELLQLKRKWERIVNRGFFDNPPASVSSSQSNGAVLEGIVEGVQGVGRFIAAGLAIGELSSAPVLSPVQSPPSLPRPTHTISQSSSSISTTTTKSTRISQSSASSLEEDTLSMNEKEGDDEATQILMVYDSGATPTVSPNPAFEHHQQQQRKQDCDVQPAFDRLNSELLNTSKLHRRKSRDIQSRSPYTPPEEPIASSSRSPSPSRIAEVDAEAARLKRVAHNGTNFPPVSSIPGLAALTVGSASSPVPSWVGSVGKKWEELQRGSTFSRNQKRASILLSDVSQSIVLALSPSTSTPKSPLPYYSPSPLSSSRGFSSLLDDDDSSLPMSQIMTPSPSPVPQPKSHPKLDPIWQALEASSRPISTTADTKPKADEDEDEWNW